MSQVRVDERRRLRAEQQEAMAQRAAPERRRSVLPSNKTLPSPTTSLNQDDQDYLNDDLLQEDGIDARPAPVPPTEIPIRAVEVPRAEPVSRRPPTYSLHAPETASNRLVIALDYGTTFTGKLCSEKNWVYLTSSRCCLCFTILG